MELKVENKNDIISKLDQVVISNNVDNNSSPESHDGEVDTTGGQKFYVDAKNYWSTIPATVNGMLGGFGNISLIDLKDSSKFLKDIFKINPPPGRKYGLDCGAGIGRVAKHLLVNFFDRVDLVEQDGTFARKAAAFVNDKKLGEIYNVGLQDFEPEPAKYDIIWCQWVLSHLTNKHLIQFLQRAAKGLQENGLIILKENVTSSGEEDIDTTDSSFTRPLIVYREIIKAAKFRIVKCIKQTNLPKGLYPVYTIAIKPMKNHQ